MCERREPFHSQLRNNNEDGRLADADANANNELPGEDDRRTVDTGNLSEQDKVIVWGTDSQCDDPELAEFEMLECQELESYLIEEGEDFVGLADRKDVQVRSSPRGKSATAMDDASKVNKSSQSNLHVAGEQESSLCLLSESTEASRAELNSDADVFHSCLSTMSAVDNASTTHTAESVHNNDACRKADQHSCAKSTKRNKDVDVNLNSAVQLEANAAKESADECRVNNNRRNKEGANVWESRSEMRKTEQQCRDVEKLTWRREASKMDKSTQADKNAESNCTPCKTSSRGTQSLSLDPRAVKKQGSFDNTMKKQNSFDRTLKKQPSFESTFRKQHSFDNSLRKQGSFEGGVNSANREGRKPWMSPSRQLAPTSPRTSSFSPSRRTPASPAKVPGMRAVSLERGNSPQRGQVHKPLARAALSSGIPKPVLVPQQREPEPRKSSPPQRPKNVRPKIITYVRKNPNVSDAAAVEAPPHPLRLSSYTSPTALKDPKGGYQLKSTPAQCSPAAPVDSHRQEVQRAAATGMKPPGGAGPQKMGGKSNSFHKDTAERNSQEHEGSGVFRSPRTLRPQLGLGAVNRQPAAGGKHRVQQMGQRSASTQSGPAAGISLYGYQEHTGEKGPDGAPKSLLLKPGQSGLRPPGFSSLPARLTAFGFARSSSVSSASSNQSNDSDRCQPSQDPDILLIKASEASQETWSQPPNAPSLQRRSLPPQRSSSPLASRRDVQRESVPPAKSSSKRFAVISPKPQSPVRGRSADQAVRTQELDRALIQQLRERCEQQNLQMQILQAQFKKASMCLDVFSITTQHFCHKSESAIVKERELSLELARIRDEVAFSVANWEQLQQEKQQQESRFEAELRGLRAKQQVELRALEERLRVRHMEEAKSLRAHQQCELEELRFKQQELVEEMREDHEASLVEMEMTHGDTLATLQEEHARTVKNLKMAHEQQTKSLEEEFEKIRLSLQDQVDTLTFQNRSLRDRAKRFEEALRRSTDEQIVEALAPYKHIEEDLKSLKEVLEMKNQQIHQQDLKITELEKIAEKNVYLEERLQVLQQQNEDLKERIDKNVAVSRQLSEENANLQVHVEKESNEKKRLSRTNEELLWRLQTGELSPRMSPSSSPLHRPASGPGSPARPHSYHQ